MVEKGEEIMGQRRFPTQDELEQKREEMIRAAMQYGFSSVEAVKRSQELDRMLNNKCSRMSDCLSLGRRRFSVQ
ncbi:aspartyl-phosphate phosphatase Spo0E family protein [Alkalicoccus luteus]|nr:aspartyl-phosphate phosphatase Spo0E family protein [Alkalicoccus luteus]